jgi:eukaryotic-like serine/threonine-protein kinase
MAVQLLDTLPFSPFAAEQGDETPTQVCGRFRLEERLGSGGMASVYRAFDPLHRRSVAIKLMHPHMRSDPAYVERFRREARAMARIASPHVVKVIEAGERNGTPYIALEYVEGETLKDLIRRAGRLPVSEALGHAIDIGRALSCAHAQGLVHRDVKAANVLIDRDGCAKLTDFGVSRMLDAEPLTDAGEVLGSVLYVSPEQAMGRPVTSRSDIYSLGICLYELLIGSPPFRAETSVAIALKHLREPLPAPRSRRPDIPAVVETAIERSTAKRPRDRYPTAQAMVHDLQLALARSEPAHPASFDLAA